MLTDRLAARLRWLLVAAVAAALLYATAARAGDLDTLSLPGGLAALGLPPPQPLPLPPHPPSEATKLGAYRPPTHTDTTCIRVSPGIRDCWDNHGNDTTIFSIMGFQDYTGSNRYTGETYSGTIYEFSPGQSPSGVDLVPPPTRQPPWEGPGGYQEHP